LFTIEARAARCPAGGGLRLAAFALLAGRLAAPFLPRSKIALQLRITRRIQRSNLYDGKQSNPTAALSQTGFAF